MSRIFSFIWQWFCAVDRCASPTIPPSIPAADSGMTLDDVRGDAVSTHIATGPRLSHDVPTLPIDVASAYFCGRCGTERTKVRGASCAECKERHKQSQQMWDSLRCAVCGEKALGWNIYGGFCSDRHYRTSTTPDHLPEIEPFPHPNAETQLFTV